MEGSMNKPDYDAIRSKAELTTQEVYDVVKAHLLSQGWRAKTIPMGSMYGWCAYRTEDGMACAVGCLLTDEEARIADTAEHTQFTALLEQGLVPRRLVHHQALLDDLQQLHDDPEFFSKFDSSPVLAWAFGLLEIAERHGLTS